MTETPDTSYTPPAERVVPAGLDAVDGLTVRELAIASRQLGCDVWAAVTDQGNGAGKRWDALPILAWLWAKRRDPRAKLDPFLDLTAAQLNTVLGVDDDDDESGDEGEVDDNPTAPAPAS